MSIKRCIGTALILCMMLSLLFIPSMAVSATDIGYEVTGGKIYFDPATGTVTGCEDSVTVADIPVEINGEKVTAIGERAFLSKENLMSVTIPYGVTTIEAEAFYNCENLKNISIPESVTEIKYDAFRDCFGLESISLPEGLKTVEGSAFAFCTSLKSIVIPDSVSSVGRDLFDNCERLTSVIIGKGLTEISNHMFSNCKNLTEITIPDNILSIQTSAFEGCTNLQSIEIPDTVKELDSGGCQFEGCNNLNSAIIGNGVTSIPDSMFYGCDNLTSVSIGKNVTQISNEAFLWCENLSSVFIPKSVTDIYSGAFDACSELSDVYYEGSETDWTVISVEDGNKAMSSANIHFNCTGLPEEITTPATPSNPATPSKPSVPGGQYSDWAKDEIQKAYDYDLVPEVLKDKDLTQRISRAEFAAVSVKTFENLSPTPAIPAVTDPFTDTKDLDVLKAYNLGIVNGYGGGLFGPDDHLNREQCATMLTRAFKKVTMPGWSLETDDQFTLRYTRPAPFVDDSLISMWAKDSVYFMVANNIIKGMGDNKFAPRNTTSKEEAEGYATATREQALVIAVRMVENLK